MKKSLILIYDVKKVVIDKEKRVPISFDDLEKIPNVPSTHEELKAEKNIYYSKPYWNSDKDNENIDIDAGHLKEKVSVFFKISKNYI